jgi:hypothetical protein
MAKLVRKQVYITAEHDQKLKRLARASGVAEAELIRQALDGMQDTGQVSEPRRSPAVRETAVIRYAAGGQTPDDTGWQVDQNAWLEELAFIEARARSAAGSTERWNREDSYDKGRLRLPD